MADEAGEEAMRRALLVALAALAGVSPLAPAQERAEFDGRVRLSLREEWYRPGREPARLTLELLTERQYPHTGYCVHLTSDSRPGEFTVVLDSVTSCRGAAGDAVAPASAWVVLPWNADSDTPYRVVLRFSNDANRYDVVARRVSETRLVSIRSTTAPTFTIQPQVSTLWLVPRNSVQILCTPVRLSDSVCAVFLDTASRRALMSATSSGRGAVSAYTPYAPDSTQARLTRVFVTPDSQPLPLATLLQAAEEYTRLLKGQDSGSWLQIEVLTWLGERYLCRTGACGRDH